MIKNIQSKMARGQKLTSIEQHELEQYFEKAEHTPDLVNGIFKGGSSITQLSQITNDLGDQIAGRFISPTTEISEPTDSAFSGAFLAGQEQTMADGTQDAWLAKVNSGTVEFSVGPDGLYQNRLTDGYEHIADDGTTYRKGLLGMSTLEDRTAPSFGITYQDNASADEMLTNGGFETGDFTGWTAVSGTWDAHTGTAHLDPYSGTYMARNTGYGEKKQVAVVSPSSILRYSGAIGSPTGGIATGAIALSFYASADGTGSIISTVGFEINAAYGTWTFREETTTVPATAGSVAFRIIVQSTETSEVAFDSLSLKINPMTNYIGFEPVDGKLVSEQLDADNELGQIPVGSMKLFRVDEDKDMLVATPGAAGNVNVGTHYLITTFVDAYGETDADLTKSSTCTVATSAKTVALTAIPLGPWGTTSRRIWATVAGATQSDPTAYYLLTTVTGNVTTTATYNVADSTLDDATETIPTVNTTGSRPIFPRLATVWGDEFISNATMVYSVDAAQGYSRYMNVAAANANDGDWYKCGFMLEAGTYTFNHLTLTTTNFGRYDLYIDGVLQSSAIDLYSAALVRNVTKTASVTVTTSGYHLLEMRINGKNAASTDYIMAITKIWLMPASF